MFGVMATMGLRGIMSVGSRTSSLSMRRTWSAVAKSVSMRGAVSTG